MTAVGVALLRSVKTLARGRIWLLIAWPAVVGVLVCIGLALFFLEQLIGELAAQTPFVWLAGWGALWLAKVAAAIGGWLVILSAAFVVTMLLTANFVMPLLLRHVAGTDYPDLTRQGKESFSGALWNSLSAIVLYAAGWLVTVPLWLIPGLAFILPLFWMAWLTRRTFAYDALVEHASEEEWQRLRQRYRLPLLLLGLTLALFAHIPLLGLLTPTMAALAFIHFGLEALRQSRQTTSGELVGDAKLLEEQG
ncbi:MAG TPA: EI24 domain-containing protein [Accumulibacter sp.]|jgi:hypothetical protein|nr:EI24 domain-containing protein [Accumulibacter sp.]HQC80756.1 EI24 domain-containing protein [Accumulibacter sp.]